LPHQFSLNRLRMRTSLDVEFLYFACQPRHNGMPYHTTSDKADEDIQSAVNVGECGDQIPLV
jgi:hypothetical protein